MSALAPTRPLPTRVADTRRTALSLVAPLRRPAARVPFVVLVGALLATGLLTLLLLHTLAAQDAFTLHALQRQTAVLADTEQQLAVTDQQQAAPSALAHQAVALGMVPATEVRVVAGRRGRMTVVLSAPVAPVVIPKPVTSAAAKVTKVAGTVKAAATKPKPGTSATKPATKPTAKPTAASRSHHH